MSTSNTDRATIIIRSAEERTEALCKKLVLDQGVPEDNLFIIREAPFSAAMRKSFEIGLEQGLPWTYCVDADVLLRPGSVETMIQYAEAQKESVCELQGYIMDKFFGGPRSGGIHLYRTSLLEQVINAIPDEGTDIRPEARTLKTMAEMGYPWVSVPYIVGIHDDEQYFEDIYRKAYVQAVKHVWRAELFISLWKEKQQGDRDFQVALAGFADSLKNSSEVYIDKRQALYREQFAQAGIEEKEELNTGEYSLERIEKQILGWDESEIYRKFFPTRDGLDTKNAARWSTVKKSFDERGFITTVSSVAGNLLIRLGKTIIRN